MQKEDESDRQTWERIAKRRRQDCAILSTGAVENVLKNVPVDDHNVSAVPCKSPSDQVEYLLKYFYEVASNKSLKPQERRKAFDTIQLLRKQLDEALPDRTNFNELPTVTATENATKPQNASKVPLSPPVATSNCATSSASLAAAPSTTQSWLNHDATSDVSTKARNCQVNKTTSVNSDRRQTSNSSTSQPQQHPSITANLAVASAATAEQAASSVIDSIPPTTISKVTAPGWQKSPPPPEWTPPPYQRTSDAVAKEKAKKDAIRKNTTVSTSISSSSAPALPANGRRHPQEIQRKVTAAETAVSFATTTTSVQDNSLKKKQRQNTAVAENGELVVPESSSLSVAHAKTSSHTSSAMAQSITQNDNGNQRQDLESKGDQSKGSSHDNDAVVRGPKEAIESPSPKGQETSAKLSSDARKISLTKEVVAPSRFLLETETTVHPVQTAVHFPADLKSRGACYSYSQSERQGVRVVFHRHMPTDRMSQQARQIFHMWEPYWQVDTIVAEGVTSKIDNLEWDTRSKKLMNRPLTAGMSDLSLLPADEVNSKIEWGINKLDPYRKPKDGDYALLLRMLPLQSDMKYKNRQDTANCHLWPKGTYLMINGKPVVLQQRKQANHDYNKWEYPSHPLDLAQHIASPKDGATLATLAMCCYDSTPFLYMVAICCYKSPSTLTRALLRPGNPVLQRLSLDESWGKAMGYIHQQSISLDGDDDAPETSKSPTVGKLVFSLLDPISKVPMKTPVRGQRCKHWQCFDLESFMVVNAPVSGGRWRCACCELFVSCQELQFCSLTQQVLATFGSTVTATRNRVEFRTDKSFILLQPAKPRYANNKRTGPQQPTGQNANSKSTQNQKQELRQRQQQHDESSAPRPPPPNPQHAVIEIIDSD